MKLASMSLVLGSMMLRFCGSSEPPPRAAAPSVAAVPGDQVATAESARVVVRAPARAMHGGVLIRAGAYDVELITKRDGRVMAYVKATDGTVAAAGTTLTVKLRGADGAEHPVALAWDSDSERFEGRLAGVTVASGAAEVVLVANGQAAQGAGALTVSADGDMVQIGPNGVQVTGHDGERAQVQAGRVVAAESGGNRVVLGPAGGVVTNADGNRVILGPGGLSVRRADGETVDIGAGGVVTRDGRVQVGPGGVTVRGTGGATVHVGGVDVTGAGADVDVRADDTE